jgi:hypothetical protein
MVQDLVTKFQGLEGKDQLFLAIASLALAVSVVSAFISGRTLHYNVLKRPQLRMIIGDRLGLMYETKPDLKGDIRCPPTSLYMDIVILNDGAKHGALLGLSGTISRKGDTSGRMSGQTSTGFVWHMFVEAKNLAAPSEPFRPMQEFAGWTTSLAIPGHGSVTKAIRFRTEGQSIELTEGEYDVKLSGRAHPERRWLVLRNVVKQGRTVRISSEHLPKLEGADLEGDKRPIAYLPFNRAYD